MLSDTNLCIILSCLYSKRAHFTMYKIIRIKQQREYKRDITIMMMIIVSAVYLLNSCDNRVFIVCHKVDCIINKMFCNWITKENTGNYCIIFEENYRLPFFWYTVKIHTKRQRQRRNDSFMFKSINSCERFVMY